MSRSILPKDKVREALAKLNDVTIYGPTMVEGSVVYQRLESAEELELDYPNSQRPPKVALLPQNELMMEYKLDRSGFEVEDRAGKEQESVLLAARPCDCRAFVYLDRVMLEGKYEDPYYKARRDKLTVVGLACNSPPYPSCFCTSVGGDPHSKDGMDVQMVDLGDRFVLEPLTEKGETLVGRLCLDEAPEGDAKAADELAGQAGEKVPKVLELDGIYEKMAENFESGYWTDVSMACIGCGVCTFLCPTCFCFDIADIGSRKGGQRVRVWDTCQFPEYSLHASAHNPRDDKMKRQRQRFYHKYKYSLDNQKMVGCTGCGRCVRQCPVNIDIVEVILGVKSL